MKIPCLNQLVRGSAPICEAKPIIKFHLADITKQVMAMLSQENIFTFLVA